MKRNLLMILGLLVGVVVIAQFGWTFLVPQDDIQSGQSSKPVLPPVKLFNAEKKNPGHDEEPPVAIQELIQAMQEIGEHQGILIPSTTELGEILNEVDIEIRNLEGEWILTEDESTLTLNYGNSPSTFEVKTKTYTNGDVSFTIIRDKETDRLIRFEYYDAREETVEELGNSRLVRITLLDPPQKIDTPWAPGGNEASLVVEDGEVDVQVEILEEIVMFKEVYKFERLYFAKGETNSFNEVPEPGEEVLREVEIPLEEIPTIPWWIM